MLDLDDIKPFDDAKVNAALRAFRSHPFLKAMFHFTFPDKGEREMIQILNDCNSVQDFHEKFICHSVRQVVDKSTEGLHVSGFEKLDPRTPYLFISNHRDIVLDTCILNLILNDYNLIMTASAIGDNLVQKPSLHTLAKLNRNFLIVRNLPPKDSLRMSRITSKYVHDLITQKNRSVWIAQRQGRTKNGDDRTEQGILKMLLLNKDKKEQVDYLAKLNIVPVSISYEFDPTDILKIPELMAKIKEVEYIKTENEDFNTILKGVMGKKGRVNITAGAPINDKIRNITKIDMPLNNQLQELLTIIDSEIHQNYQLCPPNYIAYDMLHEPCFQNHYTDKEKRQFERRLEKRTTSNTLEIESFKKMYANPVINKLKNRISSVI